MNIFSNIGVTELLVILLLALLVIGPERLPEFGRKLGKAMRDIRTAYDKLTRDLGPELSSLQKTTRELRESVDAVRSIPGDAVRSVVQATDLEDTVTELQRAVSEVADVRATLADAERAISTPVQTALAAAKSAALLAPPASTPQDGTADTAHVASLPREIEAGEETDG